MTNFDGKSSSTLNAEEVAKFSALSSHWWDETGPHQLLHQMTPQRIHFIRDVALDHFKCSSLSSKTVLDVGCGGGLLCEPLHRLGATITGIDASEAAIDAAQQHATVMGLDITYQVQTIEETSGTYDIVMASEVIEHVNDPRLFLQHCCTRTALDGLLILSTLNRTWKSYALAILGAEYALRWVPVGTHDWQKFLQPAEIANILRENHFAIKVLQGLTYNLMQQTWSLSHHLDVNYILAASRIL